MGNWVTWVFTLLSVFFTITAVALGADDASHTPLPRFGEDAENIPKFEGGTAAVLVAKPGGFCPAGFPVSQSDLKKLPADIAFINGERTAFVLPVSNPVLKPGCVAVSTHDPSVDKDPLNRSMNGNYRAMIVGKIISSKTSEEKIYFLPGKSENFKTQDPYHILCLRNTAPESGIKLSADPDKTLRQNKEAADARWKKRAQYIEKVEARYFYTLFKASRSSVNQAFGESRFDYKFDDDLAENPEKLERYYRSFITDGVVPPDALPTVSAEASILGLKLAGIKFTQGQTLLRAVASLKSADEVKRAFDSDYATWLWGVLQNVDEKQRPDFVEQLIRPGKKAPGAAEASVGPYGPLLGSKSGLDNGIESVRRLNNVVSPNDLVMSAVEGDGIEEDGLFDYLGTNLGSGCEKKYPSVASSPTTSMGGFITTSGVAAPTTNETISGQINSARIVAPSTLPFAH
jgi:hypothetical protein